MKTGLFTPPPCKRNFSGTEALCWQHLPATASKLKDLGLNMVFGLIWVFWPITGAEVLDYSESTYCNVTNSCNCMALVSLQIQTSNKTDVLLDSGLKLSNIIVILGSKLQYEVLL